MLWRYHVAKEDTQVKVNQGERLPSDATIKRRQERMIMGMTGTLIPDITPRQSHHGESVSIAALHDRSLLASSSGKRLLLHASNGFPTGHGDVRASVSRSGGARSHKTESVCSRSSSSSSLASSSSTRSLLRLTDVQEILESQSRLLRAKTDEELRGMRSALQEEARKREDAERKIQFLCEKLGIQE